MTSDRKGISPVDEPRTLIITGAASGIGLAVLAEQADSAIFDRVVALDTAIAPANGLARSGLELVWAEVDVSDAAAVDSALVELQDKDAPYAGVVNSAGNHDVGDSLEVPLDDFRRIVDVHLMGTFLVSRRAAKLMPANGSIVNLSSVAAQFGLAGRAAYSAAKAGIEGLTRALAVEWAPRGVRVNAVAPGYIDTTMGLKGIKSRGKAEQLHPLNRLGMAKEVAATISFLLSEEASFITGTVVVVDGGYSVYKGA